MRRRQSKPGPLERRHYRPGGTVTITFRTTKEIRRKLEIEARQRNRTLSDTTHMLLAERLKTNFYTSEAFGDGATRALAMLVAQMSRRADSSGTSWRQDPWAFEVLKTQILELFKEIKPKGRLKPPPGALLRSAQRLGRAFASGLISFLYVTPVGLLDNPSPQALNALDRMMAKARQDLDIKTDDEIEAEEIAQVKRVLAVKGDTK